MIKSKMIVVLSFILCFSILFAGCGMANSSSVSEPTTEKQKNSEASPNNTDSQEDEGIAEKATTEEIKENDIIPDSQAKTVMLNSGYEMPIIGLGTFTLDNATTENSVYHALLNGYRLLDTAKYYGNEAGVGNGVRRAIDEGVVTREEVFITTKILPNSYSDYAAAIKESNEILGLDYIDLMLIHTGDAGEKELYKAIEDATQNGTVRSLGISNYYTKEEFDEITENALILPAVIQNENHPYYQNTELQNYVSQYGTVVESYYPLGGRGHTQDLFNDETIAGIAQKHNKTSPQILLRWHIQAGYIAIPGSSNPEHIAENIDIFDFELSDDEMNRIADMNISQRYETW